MPTHANAVEHSLTWRRKNTPAYNEYMRKLQKKLTIWRKISKEFLKILL